MKPIFCNHDLINQDKFFKFGTQVACCILLDISSVFCKNFILRILDFSKFSGLFFYMFWDISLKLGIYMQQVVLHVKFEFHSNRDTLTYFTAKNRSKSFICIHGLKNHIEASDLVYALILCLDPYWFSSWLGNFGPLADKNTWKGVLLELPASEKFSGLFCTWCEISVWNLAYTSSGDGVTRQVRVSFQSGHFDLFYCQK